MPLKLLLIPWFEFFEKEKTIFSLNYKTARSFECNFQALVLLLYI